MIHPHLSSASSRHAKYHSRILLASSIGNDDDGLIEDNENAIRKKLRELTGFSLTAFRATARATTGFSLTALRATLRAATGVSITRTMKWILDIFPQWMRYFLQPFLILYYTPLMILRGLVGSTRDSRIQSRQAHEHVVEEWKNAVKLAETVNEQGYWPVRVNDDGFIEASLPPHPDTILGPGTIDVVDAVAKSIEVASSKSESGSNE